MHNTVGLPLATPPAPRLGLLLVQLLASVLAVSNAPVSAFAQTEKRACPDARENATAAEQALCWFQRDSAKTQECAGEKDRPNECISQAAAWCADASLDIDPVTNACLLSAIRTGQLKEAREIAGYLQSPTKQASVCRDALKMATIRVVSNPPGAEITVDDRSYGQAPVEVRLTGNWWESRIKGRFGASPDAKQIEVSRDDLLQAFDRRECVFGDLIIDESAIKPEQPPPPVAAEQPPEEQPPIKAEAEPEKEPTAQAEPGSETDLSDTDAQLEIDTQDSSIYPYVFMGVGGALIAGSVVTGVLYASSKSELDDKCDETTEVCDTDKSTLDNANALAITTDVLLFTGIAALGTGLVWLLLDSGEAETEPSARASASTAPALACSPHGCLGRVTVDF